MHLQKMLISCILYAFVINGALSMEAEVVVLKAVRGQDARLPCGQGRVFLDGPDSYVLWLKNDRDFLYRFPHEQTEKRALNRDRIYGTTCESGACHDDTSLLIKRVSDKDRGLYRCRVHYQASPSVDYVIDVRLVNSPGAPRLYNGDGKEINRGYVGPLSLGSDLTLICEVHDRQPETLVYWRRNGVIVERAHSTKIGVLRAEVRARNITRNELDANYECLAQNADVSEPLIAAVVVKMFLPPMSVEVRMDNNNEFEAGQPRVVDCVVIGCVPPPSVTWHLGETMLRPSVHKELHDGNYTVSSLTLAPSLRDNGKKLVCRAHNSHLPNVLFTDNVTISVGYRPHCLMTREETVGAVAHEAETVSCTVEASPEPIQFGWTFADGKTLYTSVSKVPGHPNRYTSSLTWLARDADIGILMCRATNSFGEQKKPCTYIVSPGGPPNEPDCVVLRSYPQALRVQCKKGWDGGRPQTVRLEILDEEGKALHNVSDQSGHFYLPSVEEGRNLTAVTYATNERGRSDSTTIYLITLAPLSASVSDDMEPSFDWHNFAEAAAIVVSIGITATTITLVYKIIRVRRREGDLNLDIVPRPDGSFQREPDFYREERVLGTTNITVNQLAGCQNQYAPSPVPTCRVLVGCGEPCSSSQHSYYV